MAADCGNYGPGFRRMRARAGPAALEALRQDAVAQQAAALADARRSREITDPTDRDWYRDYPVPKRTKHRRTR